MVTHGGRAGPVCGKDSSVTTACLSTKYSDLVEDHGMVLSVFAESATQAARGSASALAGAGRDLLASFAMDHRQALAPDDAFRAIAPIARAGVDTPKVRPVLREIAEDRDRVVAGEREPCSHG